MGPEIDRAEEEIFDSRLVDLLGVSELPDTVRRVLGGTAGERNRLLVDGRLEDEPNERLE